MGYSCCYCSTTTAAFVPQLPPVLLFTPLTNRQPHHKVSDPLRRARPHLVTHKPRPRRRTLARSRYRPRPSRLVAAPRKHPPKNRRTPRAPASLTAAARVGCRAAGSQARAPPALTVLASAADPYSVHTPAPARAVPAIRNRGRGLGRRSGWRNWLGD